MTSSHNPVTRGLIVGSQRPVIAWLRRDTSGGLLLIVAAVAALALANSPFASWYEAVRDFEVGYAPWHLQLSLGAWASDGLLALFFFLVGLELKRELVVGDLRSLRGALVPVAAAAGGVIVPALIYVFLTSSTGDAASGWAIPTATDIAFALAILALIGSALPGRIRLFLLTLAVVDDLIAIAIIALFYTKGVALIPLLIGSALIACYGWVVHRFQPIFERHTRPAWLLLLPLGILAWGFIHASGIHATIAGVALGFMVPVRRQRQSRAEAIHSHQQDDGTSSLAEQFEYRFRPISAGLAVPLFAFFAAGVSLGGPEGIRQAFGHPITIAVLVALVVGKPIGIVAATWLLQRSRSIRQQSALATTELLGIGCLAGVGFTVSLLVTELSFAPSSLAYDAAKIGISSASLLAIALASAVLLPHNRKAKARARATS